MIIQSLVDYYKLLCDDPDVDIPRMGYSTARVKLAAVISADGDLLDIIPLSDKPNGFENMIVPEQEVRTSKKIPYFLCDKSEYVFGWKFNAKSNTKKADYFIEFKDLHERILKDINNSKANALLNFLQKWRPDEALQNSVIKNKVEILARYNGNIVFRLDGEKGYIHEDKDILAAWEKYYNRKFEAEEETGKCLVSGTVDVIERTHPKIRGVKGANCAGASLVSFNSDAFESYNKKQGYNSPIGKRAAFSYAAALNFMLDRERHNIEMQGLSLVFWAQDESGSCEDLFQELISPGTISDKHRYDAAAVEDVKDALATLKQGKDIKQKEDVTFNILGLSPSNARLSVRFWYKNNFGEIVKQVWQHHQDMKIVKPENATDNISIYKLLTETVSRVSKNKSVSPVMTSELLKSILKGCEYPIGMYLAILNRVKVEKDVNYIRAGFIKAYLTRNTRRYYKEKEGIFTVSLNEKNTNTAYRLGRLFAVLEKVQKDAADGELNTTIKDRYFASATSSPRTVFPVLLRLAQHHIAKDKHGIWKDAKIQEILQGIDALPAHLTLEEQGLFILGYYHQKEAFYKKANDI